MAGAGYKLFNTGDVLTAADVNTYLMQQTTMVFANAAARTTALSGVVAEGMISYLKDTKQVEVYNGTAWIASDDPNAIQNTIVDAKGDLITATGNDVPARLAVGSDGSTIVANSASSTGLAWAGPIATAGKNFLINGNFDIWQRGTTFNNAAAYTSDRWYSANGGTGTITRQTTGVPAGSQYCWRFTAGAANVYAGLYQFIETANVAPLQGRTVTAQIKLRRNSTMNTTLVLLVDKSSTVDAGAGATWTNMATSTASNAQLPTGTTSSDWYTVTATFTVPNDGTCNSIRFNVQEGAVLPNGSVWEAAQGQLEIGSVATSFTRAGGTLQGELAACQRYYNRLTNTSDITSPYAVGSNASGTDHYVYYNYPVTMRTTPTPTFTAANTYYVTQPGVVNVAVSSIAGTTAKLNNIRIALTTATNANFAAGKFCIFENASTSYVELSAEL